VVQQTAPRQQRTSIHYEPVITQQQNFQPAQTQLEYEPIVRTNVNPAPPVIQQIVQPPPVVHREAENVRYVSSGTYQIQDIHQRILQGGHHIRYEAPIVNFQQRQQQQVIEYEPVVTQIVQQQEVEEIEYEPVSRNAGANQNLNTTVIGQAPNMGMSQAPIMDQTQGLNMTQNMPQQEMTYMAGDAFNAASHGF